MITGLRPAFGTVKPGFGFHAAFGFRGSFGTAAMKCRRSSVAAGLNSVLRRRTILIVRYGMTPLMFARMFGRTDVAELLVAHGANRQARTRFGLTAGQLAWFARPLRWLAALLQRRARRRAGNS